MDFLNVYLSLSLSLSRYVPYTRIILYRFKSFLPLVPPASFVCCECLIRIYIFEGDDRILEGLDGRPAHISSHPVRLGPTEDFAFEKSRPEFDELFHVRRARRVSERKHGREKSRNR